MSVVEDVSRTCSRAVSYTLPGHATVTMLVPQTVDPTGPRDGHNAGTSDNKGHATGHMVRQRYDSATMLVLRHDQAKTLVRIRVMRWYDSAIMLLRPSKGQCWYGS